MTDSSAFDALGAILITIGDGSLLFSAVVFYLLREVQPVKRRFNVISIMTGYGLFGLITDMYIGLTDQLKTCWTGHIWRIVFLNPVIGFAIQATELYLVYNFHSVLLKGDKSDKEEKEECERLKEKIGWKNTVRWYLSFHAVQVTLDVASILYATSMGGGFEDTCHTFFITITDVLNALILLVALGVLGWKLRNVEDTNWAKSETNLLGLVSIFFGAGGFVLQFFPTTARIGTALLAVCFTSMAVISYAVPSIMAIIRWVRGDANVTSGTDLESGNDFGSDEKDDERFQYFKDHPRIHALFHSGIRDMTPEYARKFAAKCQDIRISRSLLCEDALCKYSKLEDDVLVGNAYLLKQKFLVENAYLAIDYASDDTRVSIIGKLDGMMDLIAKDEERTGEENGSLAQQRSGMRSMFDGLQKEVEDFLAEHFFRHFFRDEHYRTLKAQYAVIQKEVPSSHE